MSERAGSEEQFLVETSQATFVDAKTFARAGLEHAGNNECHNSAVAFEGSWRVTVIAHGNMGHAAYVWRTAQGEENLFAIPSVHDDAEHMKDAQLYPKMFPNVARNRESRRQFVDSLRIPTIDELFALHAVMRYLAQQVSKES